MNTVSFSLGFILFFSLIVWIFLANNMYLKIFFLKKSKKKSRDRSKNNVEDDLFENALGGDTTPQYIKSSILKSQDKNQLLALYLASRSFNNIGVYNKLIKSQSDNLYNDCVLYITNSISKFFKGFIYILRVFAILGILFLSYIFFDKVFLGLDYKIESNSQFIVLSVLILFVLMPYKIISVSAFFNRLFGLSVFLSSILLALFTVVYIHGYTGDLIFNKLYFSIFISVLITFIGAYSYIEYLKIEYMVNFFELLKVNQAQRNLIESQTL